MSETSKVDPRNRTVHAMTVCPHCSEAIEVSIRVCGPPGEGVVRIEDAPDWRAGLDEQSAALLDAAEKSGVLEAFKEAAGKIILPSGPRHPDKYFLTWLRMAQPVAVKRDELDLLRSHFQRRGGAGGQIVVHAFQGIGSVSVDGDACAFIPVLGKQSRKVPLGLGPSPAERLETWVRSRFGYVPSGRGSFSMAMRERSVGAFARLVQ